jgi:maltose alpha-D-glucosyltransferase/alpha-amylase
MPATASALLRLTATEREEADPVDELIGPYLDAAQLLGRRTGELHRALSQERRDPAFAPEPYSSHYQRSIYQSMRNLLGRAMQLLERRLPGLPEGAQPLAGEVLALAGVTEGRYRAILGERLDALRIRVHGDYHLGQVLYTGDDFAILDFEGEPARPLSERKLKRSPLRDVAGMLRSFDYATHGALEALRQRGEREGALEAWRNAWQVRVSAAFLRSYLDVVADTGILPRDPERLAVLLDAYLLDKAMYELTYELNNRPTWVTIPLQGILDLIRR